MRYCLIFISILVCSASALANSSSRTIAGNTVAFEFNCGGEDCQTGRFVNGEPWVVPITTTGDTVGTVTITAISPDGVQHAAESNPSSASEHGILTGWPSYRASKNVMTMLPYRAQPGESIIKMVAKVPNSECDCSAAQRSGCAAVYDVLTVLDEVPPDNGATIFRPPYAGTDKPLRSISHVHMERLPRIPQLSGTDFASAWPAIVNRWNSPGYELCHAHGEMMRAATPVDVFGFDYASDTANRYLGDLLRVFGTDTGTEKEAAIYALMQPGFDNYAIYKLDISFGSGAGQHLGKKPPIVFAAAMYDDSVMLEDTRAAVTRPGSELFPQVWFQEDDQVFTTPHSTTPVWGNRVDGTGSSGEERWYWWTLFQRFSTGSENKKNLGDPYGYIDGPGGGPLNATYQWNASGPFTSFAFAMHLMPWMMYANNDQEIITYVDRIWNGRGIDGFDGGWWGAPDPCAPPDPRESDDCRPHQGAGCIYYEKTWGPDPNNPGDCIHHNGDPLVDGRYSSLHGHDFAHSSWTRLSKITETHWDQLRDCADPTHSSYPCEGLGPTVEGDNTGGAGRTGSAGRSGSTGGTGGASGTGGGGASGTGGTGGSVGGASGTGGTNGSRNVRDTGSTGGTGGASSENSIRELDGTRGAQENTAVKGGCGCQVRVRGTPVNPLDLWVLLAAVVVVLRRRFRRNTAVPFASR